MCVKRTEDAGAMSEDDGLPCSPPEYTTPHTTMVPLITEWCPTLQSAEMLLALLTLLFFSSSLHHCTSQSQAQRNSAISLEGTESDDDQVNNHVTGYSTRSASHSNKTVRQEPQSKTVFKSQIFDWFFSYIVYFFHLLVHNIVCPILRLK